MPAVNVVPFLSGSPLPGGLAHVPGLRIIVPEALRRPSCQLLRQRQSNAFQTSRRLLCQLLRQRQRQPLVDLSNLLAFFVRLQFEPASGCLRHVQAKSHTGPSRGSPHQAKSHAGPSRGCPHPGQEPHVFRRLRQIWTQRHTDPIKQTFQNVAGYTRSWPDFGSFRPGSGWLPNLVSRVSLCVLAFRVFCIFGCSAIHTFSKDVPPSTQGAEPHEIRLLMQTRAKGHTAGATTQRPVMQTSQKIFGGLLANLCFCPGFGVSVRLRCLSVPSFFGGPVVLSPTWGSLRPCSVLVFLRSGPLLCRSPTRQLAVHTVSRAPTQRTAT